MKERVFMKKYRNIALLCGVMAICMLFCSCGQFGGGREQIDNVLDKIFGTETGTETAAPEEGSTTGDAAQEIVRYDYFGNDMAQFVTVDKALYASFTANVGSDYVLTDEVFEEQIQSMLYQNATATNGTEKVTDQAIRFGDKAYIYYRGEVDGEEFEGGSNMSDSTPYALGIGSGSFIPGFESGLIGVVPAETSKDNPYPVHVTFPENYGGDLSGKDAIFYVVVEYVVQYDVPELTDAFVKDTLKYEPEGDLPDVEGALVEDYLKTMRKGMEESLAESAKSAAYSMVMEELTEKLTFSSYPDGEVDYYYNYYIEEFEYYYSYYSYMYGYTSLDEFAIDYMGLEKGDDWKAILTEDCRDMVKSSILVHAIAENEGIEEITDEEFQAELDYLVDYYEGQYTAEYIRENMGDDAIKDSALYAKIMEFILERTTITYE
ncbi:MAG: FKBP-type peptidyl-prolyl cis-trans isomerase [Clostridia bacterium]|nr:FKBP-type peptidyl-prolyl cis-trans isomerase [Clostridia bacterium]